MRNQICQWLVLILAANAAYSVPLFPKPKRENGVSAVGDPGMKRDGLRVGFEAWNFCNEVGEEAPFMGSPRAADCFDLSSTKHKRKHRRNYGHGLMNRYTRPNVTLHHKVTKADNKLGVGKTFPGISAKALNNPDLYAAAKELYLGSLCHVENCQNPYQFWMIMLKNGNFDSKAAICPENGKKAHPFNHTGLPCFGKGCMNQPILNHSPTILTSDGVMRGGFNGTYDLDSFDTKRIDGISFFEVTWEKKVGVGSWIFSHKLKTSTNYPWLMLYLRADATKGFSGGYHYDTRGMLETLPESPNFKVRLTLDVKKGGGSQSQFYLIDMGSCWKNNGAPCDGDVLTDITRYSEMIINPAIGPWCSPSGLQNCPPYHITPDNKKIYRNDTKNFPYGAYHFYCPPGNAKYLEKPYSPCDAFSNPHGQEIVQLLPHPIWGKYGYPTKKGDGWIGDSRTWELDVGGLSSRLYFYQDPGTTPAKRIWTSLDVGTEIFMSKNIEVAEWTLSDFDVILTSPSTHI